MKLTISCVSCRKSYHLEVNREGYNAWRYGGMLIQNALPDLTASERELLISGLCDTCYAGPDDDLDDDSDVIHETFANEDLRQQSEREQYLEDDNPEWS